MKKILMLCSVILVLSIIVTAFTACGDKTEDNTTTTAESAVAADSGYTAEIGDSEAVVKKGDEVFQTLKYPINTGMTFDKAYAEKNNQFLDMNFDGESDFYIAISSVDGVISYYCWLYNATTKQFDYSVILSALKNISVDADEQRILSTVEVGGETRIISYRWVDGQLISDTDYSDSEGGIPEEITKVVQENAIGVEKETEKNESTGKKETTTKKQNGSNNSNSSDKTTKPNKPSNTTTTSPKSNVIVVETGSLNSNNWY